MTAPLYIQMRNVERLWRIDELFSLKRSPYIFETRTDVAPWEAYLA